MRTARISVNTVQTGASEVNPGSLGTLLEGVRGWGWNPCSATLVGPSGLALAQLSNAWQRKTQVETAGHPRDWSCTRECKCAHGKGQEAESSFQGAEAGPQRSESGPSTA